MSRVSSLLSKAFGVLAVALMALTLLAVPGQVAFADPGGGGDPNLFICGGCTNACVQPAPSSCTSGGCSGACPYVCDCLPKGGGCPCDI